MKQWNATRYVLLGLHLLYYTLYGSDEGVGLSPAEWDMMIARQLITETEAEVLAKYAGFKPMLALIAVGTAPCTRLCSLRAFRHRQLARA